MVAVGDYGLDFAWGRPGVPAIQAGKYTFVMRYLSWATSGKNLTKPELDSYLAGGLAVGLNWEYSAKDQLRGAVGGHSDGAEAYRQAKALNAPPGSVIYFSADWDVQASELPTCRSYWAAAELELKGEYKLGVYGGYRIVADALAQGYWGWQTYAWSYGRWANAHIRQIENEITVGGADVDRNQYMRPGAGLIGETMALTDADAKLVGYWWTKQDCLPDDPNKNYTAGGALFDTSQRVIAVYNTTNEIDTKVDQLLSGGGDMAPVIALLNQINSKLDALAAENAELRAKLSAAYA